MPGLPVCQKPCPTAPSPLPCLHRYLCDVNPYGDRCPEIKTAACNRRECKVILKHEIAEFDKVIMTVLQRVYPFFEVQQLRLNWARASYFPGCRSPGKAGHEVCKLGGLVTEKVESATVLLRRHGSGFLRPRSQHARLWLSRA